MNSQSYSASLSNIWNYFFTKLAIFCIETFHTFSRFRFLVMVWWLGRGWGVRVQRMIYWKITVLLHFTCLLKTSAPWPHCVLSDLVTYTDLRRWRVISMHSRNLQRYIFTSLFSCLSPLPISINYILYSMHTIKST